PPSSKRSPGGGGARLAPAAPPRSAAPARPTGQASSQRGLPGGSGLVAPGAAIASGKVLTTASTAGCAALNAAPLLHLATHAIADPESSQRHRILLPDTYLYASQLQPATLDHVQLAVLSACDTSRGPQLRGEGVQSLSRAFLAAGVRATIASHWKVDDQATRLFMQRLYTHLREQSPLSTALLRTRQEFRAARAPARVWAAFTVQGAARDTIPAAYSWPQCLAVLGVLLALAAWALARRPSSRPPTAARL
ncbi:CHAT domain-containing protein, partial [Nostoc sp. NIES-2111]